MNSNYNRVRNDINPFEDLIEKTRLDSMYNSWFACCYPPRNHGDDNKKVHFESKIPDQKDQKDQDQDQDQEPANDSKRGSGSTVLAALTEDIHSKYIFGPMLGRGAYGEVVACMENSSRKVYACKILKPKELLETEDGPNVIGRLRNEIASLSYLAGHPNIIQLIDVYETNTTLYMVQEMCRGGNLMQLIEKSAPISEQVAAQLFRGMIKSVLHCHQMGIVHRDIKPDNFLLSKKGPEAVLKLADFGLSCFHRNEMMTEAVGSPFYMAPEMIRRRQYSVEADIWSCGISLYRMLSGHMPINGKTSREVFQVLKHSPQPDFSDPVWKTISFEAKQLVSMLLKSDPQLRVHGQDVLRHSWLGNNQRLEFENQHKNQNVLQRPIRSESVKNRFFMPTSEKCEIWSGGTNGSQQHPQHPQRILGYDTQQNGVTLTSVRSFNNIGTSINAPKYSSNTSIIAGNTKTLVTSVNVANVANVASIANAAVACVDSDVSSYDGQKPLAKPNSNLSSIRNNKVTGKTSTDELSTSARVFFSPTDFILRTHIHTFIDMFKKNVEEPYVKLLQAITADDAAIEWDFICTGFVQMDDFLERYASHDGPYFLGLEPSLAEAAIAPSLYRMYATLPAIRDLELLTTCEELRLERFSKWIREVLDRPTDCCDVLALPQHVYVHLARRLYVKYEGPPSVSILETT